MWDFFMPVHNLMFLCWFILRICSSWWDVLVSCYVFSKILSSTWISGHRFI